MYLKSNILFLKKNISFKSMADTSGIPRSTLNDLATGKITNPKLDLLIKLRDYFKVSIDDLVFTDLSKQTI